MKSRIFAFALAFAGSVFLSSMAGFSLRAAEGGHGYGHGHSNVGKPGEATDITRTIEIVMRDNSYEPNEVSIKEGETVRFIVKNVGEFVHEFNIGTKEMHLAHQPEMMQMMEQGVLEVDRINWDAAKGMHGSKGMHHGAGHGMGMHDEPNRVLLEPGKSGEIIWTFPDHADLEFACNVPGHYDAGMHGPIKLTH